MMKKTLLTSLVLCLCSQVALCQVQQGTLKVMIENADEDGIFGAQVAVYQGEKLVTGGAPDRFGLITISSIDPGEYLVEIKYIGFETERRVVQIHANNITSIELSLEESITEIVCISSICEWKPIFHDPYGALSSFETEEILKMPVR